MALSFEKDIKPMFTDMDVDHMSRMGTKFKLNDYASVKRKAPAIYTRVKNGSMPPPSSGEKRWTDEMVAKFKQWMDEGYNP